jgi:hypothetical protein
MAYRSDKPFRQRGAFGKRHTSPDGRMSDRRVAWAEFLFGKIIVRQFWPEDETDPEMREYAEENQVGPNVIVQLDFGRNGRRPIYLNLTALTAEEVQVFRDVMDFAFDLAVPVAKDRDEVAARAKDAGDDSYSRVYRAVPQFIVRNGKVIPYGESVQDGSDDVPGGPRGVRGNPI